MSLLKILLIIICLNFNLYAKNNDVFSSVNTNKLYVFPDEANDAEDDIIKLIKKSKKNIIIAMYNFSYKKFAKQLVDKAKNEIKITIILDKSKIEKKDKIYKYLKNNGIIVKVVDKKMHMKIAIFDEKILVLGSSNWTKDSFKDNYELVLFTSNKKIINKALSALDKF